MLQVTHLVVRTLCKGVDVDLAQRCEAASCQRLRLTQLEARIAASSLSGHLLVLRCRNEISLAGPQEATSVPPNGKAGEGRAVNNSTSMEAAHEPHEHLSGRTQLGSSGAFKLH